jgi:hypothetical protein
LATREPAPGNRGFAAVDHRLSPPLNCLYLGF